MSKKSTINILAGCMILLSVMVPLIQFFRLYLHERYFSGSTWFVILSVLCMILAVLLFAKKSGWVFVILVLLICAYDTCEGIRVFKLDGMRELTSILEDYSRFSSYFHYVVGPAIFSLISFVIPLLLVVSEISKKKNNKFVIILSVILFVIIVIFFFNAFYGFISRLLRRHTVPLMSIISELLYLIVTIFRPIGLALGVFWYVNRSGKYDRGIYSLFR